ncbi:(S)-ureidoglycine aminohydrolase [Gudongella sp. SC589]|jgi:(S)-ureidoglycine aminohydrolase|uniref:(S)-ureidoglycine aminohydrolase n=1 Tax=Gudongella sp. SC589 TaxID=3385990 RepID=UPI0039047275
MGYRNDLLSSRAIINHGSFALIPPDGLVNNVIPHFEDARISVIASPKLGASFVEYLVDFNPGGGNRKGFGGDGIETFVYVISGKLQVKVDEDTYDLEEQGFLYCPPSKSMIMTNVCDENTKLVLYKQRYIPAEGVGEPWLVCDNVKNLTVNLYEDMKDVTLVDFLPTSVEFDMNFHILTFQPGGSHPYIETHVQEHGAYLLSGEGMYNLDNDWISVKKGDFIWMGPFVHQATYSVGYEPLSYVYSKDCNRDPEI